MSEAVRSLTQKILDEAKILVSRGVSVWRKRLKAGYSVDKLIGLIPRSAYKGTRTRNSRSLQSS